MTSTSQKRPGSDAASLQSEQEYTRHRPGLIQAHPGHTKTTSPNPCEWPQPFAIVDSISVNILLTKPKTSNLNKIDNLSKTKTLLIFVCLSRIITGLPKAPRTLTTPPQKAAALIIIAGSLRMVADLRNGAITDQTPNFRGLTDLGSLLNLNLNLNLNNPLRRLCAVKSGITYSCVVTPPQIPKNQPTPPRTTRALPGAPWFPLKQTSQDPSLRAKQSAPVQTEHAPSRPNLKQKEN